MRVQERLDCHPLGAEDLDEVVQAVPGPGAGSVVDHHLGGDVDAEADELVGVGRELEQGRRARAFGQLGVDHLPLRGLAGRLANQEVGAAGEAPVEERRLEDHVRAVPQRRDRLGAVGPEAGAVAPAALVVVDLLTDVRAGKDGAAPAGSLVGGRLPDERDAAGRPRDVQPEALDVVGEHALLVRLAEPGGAAAQGIVGLHELGRTAELRVESTQEQERAARGLDVRGRVDDR